MIRNRRLRAVPMKRSAFVGLFLTLLMVLMVALAAVVFMLQGRQQLLTRLQRLEGQTAALNSLVVEAENSIATRESDLATVTAAQATIEYERDRGIREAGQLQRELNDVISERDRVLADLAELEEAQSQAAPLVAFISPQDGDIFSLDAAIDILVLATDPRGLTAVHLTIDGAPFSSYEPEDLTLFTTTATWNPAETGQYLLSARAINSSGQANEPVTLTVTIVDSSAALFLTGPDPNAELRATIEANVVELRGLAPLEPVQPTLFTTAQLQQRVTEDFDDYTPEEAARDALVLSAFDFIEPDFDLYSFFIDLYSEQISGFYDPQTAEFVVVSDDDHLDPYEQTVHAHEYVHALQDQYYELGRLSDGSLDSEAGAALRALAEGDATLVQFLYIFGGYLTRAEINELAGSLEGVESAVLDDAPPLFANQLEFPYTYGLEFVRYLFAESGGFEGVDAAWANLPQSTEQIIHPERYLAGDLPQLVSLVPLTGTLGSGWQQLDEDIFGEFYLRQYLGQQLDEEAVDQAATGWGGDRYTVFWNATAEQLVMALRLAWDTAVDKAEFTDLYAAYPAALFGTSGRLQTDGATCWQGTDVICLYDLGSDLLVVRAPDQTTAGLIALAQNQ